MGDPVKRVVGEVALPVAASASANNAAVVDRVAIVRRPFPLGRVADERFLGSLASPGRITQASGVTMIGLGLFVAAAKRQAS